MARFLIATIPVVGHVSPMLPIARTLVGRGHEVWWYGGALFKETIADTGARFMPMREGLDYSLAENVPADLSTRRSELRGIAQLKFDLENFFISPALGNTRDLLNILEEFPADALLVDSFFIAAAPVHEKTGIPWAQLGVSALTFPSRDTAPFGLGLKPDSSLFGRLRNRFLNALLRELVFNSLYKSVNEVRSRLSLGPTRTLLFDVLSPYLYLAGTVPGFEYPRGDLPPQVHFIGPSLPGKDPEFIPPPWWNDLQGAVPVVLVTQGTVATDAEDLIIPTLRGLERESVLVVATTGVRPEDLKTSFVFPNNARVEGFIPFAHLLPYVDVMVTNGGFNGVQMALAHGIPLVVAGKSEDKPEICSRVARSGVGIDLRTKTPRPEQVRVAVKEVLSNAFYRQNAERLQAEIAGYNSSDLAVNLLEKLVETKRSITEH